MNAATQTPSKAASDRQDNLTNQLNKAKNASINNRFNYCFLGAICLTGAPSIMADNRIDTQRPDAPELAAYGEHAIGVRSISLINPQQIDIVTLSAAEDKPDPLPRYDRPLTLEIWYPAAQPAKGSQELQAFLRDGKTEVNLQGRAHRDATPAAERFPLVLISHGYPGNRFLLSHLAENIASKGYVVASIDHTDSTYRTKAAFGSTLVNRSLDQKFVLEKLSDLSNDNSSFLGGLVDADNTALIGYSMGAYGSVITAGGGVTQSSVDLPWGAPHGTLAMHLSGSDSHAALEDARIKTAIAVAPWGMNHNFWSNETLAGVRLPMLFVAGSEDDVSGYENGIRAIWSSAKNVERSLLTFDNANHNAAAPIPAPLEANKYDDDLGFNLSEHYSDAVWDTTRMNNILQHFSSAWLGKYLKKDKTMDAYLSLVPHSNEGVWAEKDGEFLEQHSYWTGFAHRSAKGLRFETLSPDK